MSTTLKLTVAEYDVMVERGAFDDLAQKIELINGEIQAMNPAGPIHDDYISFLLNWSIRNTDIDDVHVRVQSGLSLPAQNSRPEPDVLWVKARRYLDSHPTSDDVLLLIEVSHSSLKSDQAGKENLYARARIVEYWIVDVEHQQIHVHRDPDGQRYQTQFSIDAQGNIAPQIKPQSHLIAAKLFGP